MDRIIKNQMHKKKHSLATSFVLFNKFCNTTIYVKHVFLCVYGTRISSSASVPLRETLDYCSLCSKCAVLVLLEKFLKQSVTVVCWSLQFMLKCCSVFSYCLQIIRYNIEFLYVQQSLKGYSFLAPHIETVCCITALGTISVPYQDQLSLPYKVTLGALNLYLDNLKLIVQIYCSKHV